jgi:alcohol dehydrogenase
VATAEPGRVLGHEAVGTVVEVGAGTRTVKEGDHVLLACISACGRCRFCRVGNFGQCEHEEGGWVLGNTVDGLQAEYARIPFADNSVHRVPDGLTDEQVIYLTDILSTGMEVGVLKGNVQPGDTVAIVGAGPVGLSTLLTARLYSPASIVVIDLSEARQEFARRFGADEAIGPDEAMSRIAELTDGLGADVAIEAVGGPGDAPAVHRARPSRRTGGEHRGARKARRVALRNPLVQGDHDHHRHPDTRVIPQLLKAIQAGTLDPTPFTTHHYAMDEMMEAYDTFERSAETNALKMVLTPGS